MDVQTENETMVRQQLVELLREGNAHRSFESVVEAWPVNLRGKKAANLPYTAWELLEHMRIAQWDILDFSRNPNYEAREWPAGYWPENKRPPSEEAWDESVRGFVADRQAMIDLIEDPGSDLYAPLAHGEGQTLFREALTLADHNSYHLGQLAVLRRLVGAWEE